MTLRLLIPPPTPLKRLLGGVIRVGVFALRTFPDTLGPLLGDRNFDSNKSLAKLSFSFSIRSLCFLVGDRLKSKGDTRVRVAL